MAMGQWSKPLGAGDSKYLGNGSSSPKMIHPQIEEVEIGHVLRTSETKAMFQGDRAHHSLLKRLSARVRGGARVGTSALSTCTDHLKFAAKDFLFLYSSDLKPAKGRKMTQNLPPHCRFHLSHQNHHQSDL